jgi:hypothetical protein
MPYAGAKRRLRHRRTDLQTSVANWRERARQFETASQYMWKCMSVFECVCMNVCTQIFILFTYVCMYAYTFSFQYIYSWTLHSCIYVFIYIGMHARIGTTLLFWCIHSSTRLWIQFQRYLQHTLMVCSVASQSLITYCVGMQRGVTCLVAAASRTDLQLVKDIADLGGKELVMEASDVSLSPCAYVYTRHTYMCT